MKRKRVGGGIVVFLVAAAGVGVSAASGLHNGDFEGGFHFVPPNDDCPISWTMLETRPEESTIITSLADNGPSAPGVSSVVWRRGQSTDEITFVPSSDWTAIEQVLAYDVTSVSELILTMDIQVLNHDHGGGGWSWDQWEYPVTVRVDYVDRDGTSRYWQFGWYEWYDDVTGPPPVRAEVCYGFGVVCSMQVPAGVWVRNTFRLSHELPGDPRTITGIRIGGSGWAFAGAVDNVTIHGPVPASSTSWGAIKNLYRSAE